MIWKNSGQSLKRKPGTVVFAAQSMVGQSGEFPQDWMNTNVLGTLNLFDLLRAQDSEICPCDNP